MCTSIENKRTKPTAYRDIYLLFTHVRAATSGPSYETARFFIGTV
jgi:predicted glutamine amidotransferase